MLLIKGLRKQAVVNRDDAAASEQPRARAASEQPRARAREQFWHRG
jgi:hypothetical protein